VDELIGVGQHRGGDHVSISGVQLAVTDVVHDGAAEQVGVLQHDAKLPAQVFLLDVADILAVDQDAAAV